MKLKLVKRKTRNLRLETQRKMITKQKTPTPLEMPRKRMILSINILIILKPV